MEDLDRQLNILTRGMILKNPKPQNPKTPFCKNKFLFMLELISESEWGPNS